MFAKKSLEISAHANNPNCQPSVEKILYQLFCILQHVLHEIRISCWSWKSKQVAVVLVNVTEWHLIVLHSLGGSFECNQQHSQKEVVNKDVQEAKFLSHICTLMKDLGVLVHLDAWSISILKARTAKNGEKLGKAFIKIKTSSLENCETISFLTANFEKVQRIS